MKLIYKIKDSTGTHEYAQREARSAYRALLNDLARKKLWHPELPAKETMIVTVEEDKPKSKTWTFKKTS